MEIEMIDTFEGKKDIVKINVDLQEVLDENIDSQTMASMVHVIFDSLKFTIAVHDTSDKSIAMELLVEHKSLLPKFLKDYIFGKKIDFHITLKNEKRANRRLKRKLKKIKGGA